MKSFLLFLAFSSTIAFAGFEKITVLNMDLEYLLPYGKGTVERVGIGMSIAPETHEIEVKRTENSFEVTTPHVDFSWINPIKFFHEIEKISAKKTSAALGTKIHYVESEYFMFRPKGRGDYQAENVSGKCEGNAIGSLDVRLLEDCRTKMQLTIKRIDVPEDFILYKLLENLSQLPIPQIDVPADHIILNIREGDFALQLYMKYWFYAGLRSWGHVQYENNHKTIAIRVDLIKFGYIPVTNLIMKKLKEIITNPNVTVDPPWIRINTGKYIENE